MRMRRQEGREKKGGRTLKQKGRGRKRKEGKKWGREGGGESTSTSVRNLFLWSLLTSILLFLHQTIKDPTIIGPYDTIAVYADGGAVEFFKKNGFTDDIILNSRFRWVQLIWYEGFFQTLIVPDYYCRTVYVGQTSLKDLHTIVFLSELTDHWINSTLMCYLPPFTGEKPLRV